MAAEPIPDDELADICRRILSHADTTRPPEAAAFDALCSRFIATIRAERSQREAAEKALNLPPATLAALRAHDFNFEDLAQTHGWETPARTLAKTADIEAQVRTLEARVAQLEGALRGLGLENTTDGDPVTFSWVELAAVRAALAPKTGGEQMTKAPTILGPPEWTGDVSDQAPVFRDGWRDAATLLRRFGCHTPDCAAYKVIGRFGSRSGLSWVSGDEKKCNCGLASPVK